MFLRERFARKAGIQAEVGSAGSDVRHLFMSRIPVSPTSQARQAFFLAGRYRLPGRSSGEPALRGNTGVGDQEEKKGTQF